MQHFTAITCCMSDQSCFSLFENLLKLSVQTMGFGSNQWVKYRVCAFLLMTLCCFNEGCVTSSNVDL